MQVCLNRSVPQLVFLHHSLWLQPDSAVFARALLHHVARLHHVFVYALRDEAVDGPAHPWFVLQASLLGLGAQTMSP